MIHHREAPWFPSDDSITDQLLCDDLYGSMNAYIEENGIKLLPDEYSITRLSLKEDRSTIQEFIARFYGNDKWKLEIDQSEFEFMDASNNTQFLGVKWRGLLIAMISIETFNVTYNGVLYKAGYGDHLIVHPKFRSTGLSNIVITNAIMEAARLGCQFDIFTTHAPLNVKSSLVKRLYNLALTDAPLLSIDRSLNRYKALPMKEQTLIEPTLAHVKRFNEMDYKMRFVYTDDQLNAMLKHEWIYTDGSSVARFNTIINVADGIRIKTAVLQDYVNVNSIAFFNEVLTDLRAKGFDMVTLFNDRTMDTIVNRFGFKKNADMKIYTVNLLPKLKPNEIHVNVR